MSTVTANAEQYTAPIGPRNDVLYRVESHFNRFVAFANPNHAYVLALWTLHTWTFDASYVTPYIYVSSVDPGAGKTTLMETAADVARNAEIQAGATPAAIYRSLVEETPTFILDEIDAIYSGAKNEVLRRVLNSGYKYNGFERIYIDGEAQRMPTFCPKLLGGIDNGQLPATIADRSIRIRLRKLSGDELAARKIERRNMKRLAKDGSIEQLQKVLSQWANLDTREALNDMDLDPTEGLSARQWEIAEPLVEVASLFGEGDKARAAIVSVFQGEKTESAEVAMLRKLRDLFADTGADRLPATEMAEVTGYPVSTMGRILSQYEVSSRPMKFAGKVQRGYFRTELETVFDRQID